MTRKPTPPPEEEPRIDLSARELADIVQQEATGISDTVKDEAVGITDDATKRAAALAQKVTDEAQKVTDRVEQRAKDLEERRVEHRVEERIEQRADIKHELTEITAALGLLVEHLDQSMPEDRLQRMAEAVLAEERLSRQRLATKIIGFLSVITVLVLSSLLLAAANRRTLVEAKTVSTYVRSCLQHPEKLTGAEKAETCGSVDQGAFFITYLNCAFLIPIPERTEARLNGCVTKAAGRAATATTATTTK